METTKNQTPLNQNSNQLNNFFKSIQEEILYGSEETINEMLIELEYNPTLVGEEGAQLIKKLNVRMKINHAKRQTEELFKKAKEKISLLGNAFTEKDRTVLARIMAGNDEALATAYFNKIKTLPKEDIVDMLEDTRLLEIIENGEEQKK